MTNVEIVFKWYVFFAVFSLIVYIPRIFYWLSGFKKQKKLHNSKKNKFAILVPARNESAGIKFLLESLKNQTYEHKYFDTFIIVNDENDPTCQIAKNYEYTKVQVVKNQTCKGEALDGSLKEILSDSEKKDYAAYIIVDGDNIVDSHFLEEMNNSLLLDKQIVLGKREIKNYLFDKKMRSLATNCSSMIYTFIDKLGNSYRSKNEIPCTMCGTGVMIRRDVIEQLGGWPYRSYTEDLEMTINCILNDWSTYFYEHAITYTEEPLSHSMANERRKRWVLGYMQIMFKYRPKIVKQTYAPIFDNSLDFSERLKEIKSENFDYLYSLSPFILYMVDTVLAFLIFANAFVYKYVVKGVLSFVPLKYAFFVLAVAYFVLVFYTAVGFLVERKAFKISFFEKIKVLFFNPIFMSEWAIFYVSAFLKLIKNPNVNPKDAWKPIVRIENSSSD